MSYDLNTTRVTRLELRHNGGFTTAEITLTRLAGWDNYHTTPEATDLPDDFRDAIADWLGLITGELGGSTTLTVKGGIFRSNTPLTREQCDEIARRFDR